MQVIRPAEERGRAHSSWLDSRHTFSFGHYHDPRFSGFGALRVINEDRVQPGAGFGAHNHEDMEILSWVIDGALEHRDSLGNGSVIRPGELQRMSAGTGVRHSEMNASSREPVHFLQVWIIPEQVGLSPGYEQRTFTDEDIDGRLCLIASRDGRDESVTVHQDVALYATRLSAGQRVTHGFAPGRMGWLQVVHGVLMLSEGSARAGDGVAISDAPILELSAVGDAEALLFDLAA